jgi:hypothetical protein
MAANMCDTPLPLVPAICSGKMILWLIQHRAQFPDIGEVFSNGSIPYPLKHRQAVEEKINRLSIVHIIQADNHKWGNSLITFEKI